MNTAGLSATICTPCPRKKDFLNASSKSSTKYCRFFEGHRRYMYYVGLQVRYRRDSFALLFNSSQDSGWHWQCDAFSDWATLYNRVLDIMNCPRRSLLAGYSGTKVNPFICSDQQQQQQRRRRAATHNQTRFRWASAARSVCCDWRGVDSISLSLARQTPVKDWWREWRGRASEQRRWLSTVNNIHQHRQPWIMYAPACLQEPRIITKCLQGSEGVHCGAMHGHGQTTNKPLALRQTKRQFFYKECICCRQNASCVSGMKVSEINCSAVGCFSWYYTVPRM